MNLSNPSLGGGLTGSESVLSGSGFVQSNMNKFGESGSGADGFVQSNMPLHWQEQCAQTDCKVMFLLLSEYFSNFP